MRKDPEMITEEQKEKRAQIKERLLGYRKALERVENAKMQLETLQEIIDFTPPDYKNPKVPGAKRKDFAEKLAEIEAMHREIDREWEDSIKELIEIKKLLLLTDSPRGFNILYRKYIRCQSWDTIAFEKTMDKRWTQRIHDRTLDEISENLERKEKKDGNN